MRVVEIRHPLIKHKLGLMREKNICTKQFRELANEIGGLLVYEATSNLLTKKKTIQGWNTRVEIERIQEKDITIVPILRAGLGMLEGILSHLPNACISIVGMYRDENTLKPIPYFQKIVPNIKDCIALVLDPMLATGGSMIATVTLLKNSGCKKVKLLVLVAAPEGITKLEEEHPDIELYTASIDTGLNRFGYIIPGLGDAGDKIFGTE